MPKVRESDVLDWFMHLDRNRGTGHTALCVDGLTIYLPINENDKALYVSPHNEHAKQIESLIGNSDVKGVSLYHPKVRGLHGPTIFDSEAVKVLLCDLLELHALVKAIQKLLGPASWSVIIDQIQKEAPNSGKTHEA